MGFEYFFKGQMPQKEAMSYSTPFKKVLSNLPILFRPLNPI